MKKIAILGTVGIPGLYGGFETLAENLARFHHLNKVPCNLLVYCSSRSYPTRPKFYLNAELSYVHLKANGVSSVAYDVFCLLSSVIRRSDVILLLGVSGALALPLVRVFTSSRIVCNIDGIEWKREKWKGFARWFLRLSERIAVSFSHEVVADNFGIADHVQREYGRKVNVIAYGGDHVLNATPKIYSGSFLPKRYALALCRIEPENNVETILEAFSRRQEVSLVFVGNWDNSPYGKVLRQKFSVFPNLYLLDPIYDLGVLCTLRSGASLYVHGHSAGGTNPSLVEMMHFGLAVVAFDCIFNRYTTQNKALWFKSSEDLVFVLSSLSDVIVQEIGKDMREIAQRQYTWSKIGDAYFNILLN